MKHWSIIAIVLLLACQDTDIDLPDGTELLVVEGWITDQNKEHWVKISRTVPFDDVNSERSVENATVNIEDELSNFYPLIHSQNGIYFSSLFSGIETLEYRLNIELASGAIIRSKWERLNPLAPIDSVNVDSFDDKDSETGEDIEVFFPIVYSNDPIGEVNYYRYKGFRNNVLLNEPDQLELLSDQFSNGKLLPNFIPEFTYSLEDTIKIELHSLTKAGFDFLRLLKSQTTSLGSSSGTSPATLSGNLKNLDDPDQIVLGFFGASSVSADSTTIVSNF